MLKNDGYRATFLWTGVVQGLVILAVAQVLRHPAAEPAVPAAAKASAGPTRFGQHQFTTGEMLRTPQFYVMYLAFLMMATGGLLLTLNAGPIADAWGVAAALAVAQSLNAVANGASRVSWGWVSDRTGRELAMIVAFVLHAGLPGARDHPRPCLGHLVHRHARAGVLHLGRALFAVPGNARRLLRHPSCHVELRRAVLREGRGVDSRRMGGCADFRERLVRGRLSSTGARSWRSSPRV